MSEENHWIWGTLPTFNKTVYKNKTIPQKGCVYEPLYAQNYSFNYQSSLHRMWQKLTQLINFTFDFDMTTIHFTGNLTCVVFNVINLNRSHKYYAACCNIKLFTTK